MDIPHNSNTFLARLNKYKYLIIVPVIIIILALLGYTLYNSYLNKKADKNSLVFNNIQEDLMAGKAKDAAALLNQLAKNGTKGYQLVAYFQKASLNINNKQYQEAIANLTAIDKLNVPEYYKDLANNIIFSIRLDQDKNLKLLIADLQKAATPKNAFYYSNLELLTIAQYATKDYNNALANLDKIITDDKAGNGIKERAKALKSLTLAYVK